MAKPVSGTVMKRRDLTTRLLELGLRLRRGSRAGSPASRFGTARHSNDGAIRDVASNSPFGARLDAGATGGAHRGNAANARPPRRTQCLHRIAAACALAGIAAWPTTLACSAPRQAEAPRDTTAAFGPQFARAPLDTPLVLNGGFGEYRSNHFHAGLDLGTGQSVGRPVYAPLGGWIERVRASGVGYGRSLYLRTGDGRLLVFAHLDAFAEPIASFIAAVQDSAAQYEQDLWPAQGRLPIAAGQRIAWTGESGAGGPHLHFEVRRGDMAYSPLRAGIAIPDTAAPTLVDVTLEPLDDASFVERGAAPRTFRLGARADTVLVQGRVRAVIGARDGVWQGVDRMLPYAVRLEFGSESVECRFDSISWATDMVESAYVFDSGRIVSDKGVVMWAPGGFRPRVLRTSAPEDREAGTLEMKPGDPLRTLTLGALDLGGNQTVRRLVLRGPQPHEIGPDTTRSGGRKTAVASDRRFDLALLPGAFWRVTYRGASAGSRGVRINDVPATTNGNDWTALVSSGAARGTTVRWTAAGRDGKGATWRDESAVLQLANEARQDAVTWSIGDDAFFEPGVVATESRTEDMPRSLSELIPVDGFRLRFHPSELPLRKTASVSRALPAAVRSSPIPTEKVGLCRTTGDGWDWLGRANRGDTKIDVETRMLGTFALFADTTAPRVRLLRPARHAQTAPYSRWQLHARITELGSGVDTRATRFEIDGRPVASEWDAEEGLLRWRPPRKPASGSHRAVVVATDRAGNVRRFAGNFIAN